MASNLAARSTLRARKNHRLSLASRPMTASANETQNATTATASMRFHECRRNACWYVARWRLTESAYGVVADENGLGPEPSPPSDECVLALLLAPAGAVAAGNAVARPARTECGG